VSRLESTARAGYFPTPPRVAAAIAEYLSVNVAGRRTVRLLDPCAGTGEAVLTVAQPFGAETYGIEINEDRAEHALSRLDHVLATSAFSVRLANGAFSVLFLNPPYADDDEKRRLEHAFLTGLTRALCVGGVLVFLIPQRRLAVSARYLASHYEGFRAYRFPDPEYHDFRQMVLFANKKPRPILDQTVERQLEGWSATELTPLAETPGETGQVVVPTLPTGEVLFATLFFDPQQAAAEAQRRGVWVQPQLADQLWPPDERPVRPLMPLRKGHLALLIAAGMLNNLVLSQDAQCLLVKGRTHKEMVPVESDDEEIQVEREVLRTSITTIDLASGEIAVIDQGATVKATERQAA